MLVKSDVLNFFVNEWREGAECTSSGKSLSIIRKAEAKMLSRHTEVTKCGVSKNTQSAWL